MTESPLGCPMRAVVGKSATSGPWTALITFVLMQSESQPRKSSRVISCDRTKTDTGRWGEKPQALGRTLVKELGKLAP